MLCIVYCAPGIRSVVYSVLGLSYIVLGHWVLGPYALDATSRATTLVSITPWPMCGIAGKGLVIPGAHNGCRRKGKEELVFNDNTKEIPPVVFLACTHIASSIDYGNAPKILKDTK